MEYIIDVLKDVDYGYNLDVLVVFYFWIKYRMDGDIINYRSYSFINIFIGKKLLLFYILFM